MTWLHELHAGEWARIVSIDADDLMTHKIRSAGLNEGRVIKMVSRCGLLTCRFHTKTFSMSSGIAQQIRVVTLSSPQIGA